MRCQGCQENMLAACYMVERFAPGREALVLNVCSNCLGIILGTASKNKLDAALVQAGFVAPRLPGFD